MPTHVTLMRAYDDVVEIAGIIMPRLCYTSLDDFFESNGIDRDWVDWEQFTNDWDAQLTMDEVENGFIKFQVYDRAFILNEFTSAEVALVAHKIKEYIDNVHRFRL